MCFNELNQILRMLKNKVCLPTYFCGVCNWNFLGTILTENISDVAEINSLNFLIAMYPRESFYQCITVFTRVYNKPCVLPEKKEIFITR